MIVYIAETKIEHDIFLDYLDSLISDDFSPKVVTLFPDSDLEIMCETVKQYDPQIVIIEQYINDIKLDIAWNVNYSSNDFIKKYKEKNDINFILIGNYNKEKTTIEKIEDKIYYIHNYKTDNDITSSLIKKLYYKIDIDIKTITVDTNVKIATVINTNLFPQYEICCLQDLRIFVKEIVNKKDPNNKSLINDDLASNVICKNGFVQTFYGKNLEVQYQFIQYQNNLYFKFRDNHKIQLSQNPKKSFYNYWNVINYLGLTKFYLKKLITAMTTQEIWENIITLLYVSTNIDERKKFKKIQNRNQIYIKNNYHILYTIIFSDKKIIIGNYKKDTEIIINKDNLNKELLLEQLM